MAGDRAGPDVTAAFWSDASDGVLSSHNVDSMSSMFTDPDDTYQQAAEDAGDDFYHDNVPEPAAPADAAVCPESEVTTLPGTISNALI
eukprot:1413843-Heterocapsa_arctica.AAC.1